MKVRSVWLLAALVLGSACAAAHAGSGPVGPAPGSPPGAATVARVWHGKTLRARADEYEQYLTAAVARFPSIPGNLGYQVMRIDGGPDGDAYSEFQVVSYWESLDAIHAYAGEDIRRTHFLPRDPEFLVDPEPYVRNYAIRVDRARH